MMEMDRKLRFAIIIGSTNLDKWKVDCLSHMLKGKELQLSLVIISPSRESTTTFGLFQLYDRLSRLRSKSLKKTIVDPLIKGVPQYSINPNVSLSPMEIQDISAMDLDFILTFEDEAQISNLQKAARHGVWTYEFGGAPAKFAGYKEIQQKESVSRVSLIQIKEDRKVKLKEGFFSTISHSLCGNRDNIYLTSAKWPAIVCKSLHHNSDEVETEESFILQSNSFEMPSFRQSINYLLNLCKSKAGRLHTKLFCYEYWNVGIVEKPIEEMLTEVKPKIQWLVQKKDMYYADPFGLVSEDGIQLLMEEVNHRVVKGYITSAHINGKEKKITWNPSILKKPFHMSYPYLFTDNGEYYCVPETSEARKVTMYKLDLIEKKWKKIKDLLTDFPAVDSTIVKNEDHWWLFCTKSSESLQSHNNELHIFYATDLFGEWKPHQLNPVKIDCRSSRPAGTPFRYMDQLYRPAQDCSRTYGGRIVLNRISILTPSSFKEETISNVEPRSDSLYPDGVHTISSVGDITILDGKRFDYSLFHIFKKLYRFKPI
ncbi:hypothetical protein LC085_18290 [Bacillus tianshenii]|uniref:glucosamine inositolphosphorylceramide transferase family protein n=1 Tax=Sutcliffiella tianshenii TaxID=1463404 RepID=UPI001CD6ABC1|nr:hypothetical protein [Bacillus tianshenii]MCA1321852.1 hypothetical protein [Bacillus tianshenii]